MQYRLLVCPLSLSSPPHFLQKLGAAYKNRVLLEYQNKLATVLRDITLFSRTPLIISRVRPCERIHRPVCTRQIRHRQMSCCLYDAKRAATAVTVLNIILDVC
jgi:hypothetical protein